MKSLRYIVTGWPCSGTRYTAAYLHACGIEAKHEAFLFDAANDRWLWTNGDEKTVVDVNHAISQWLDRPELSACTVFHLVRHPLRVLESWTAKSIRMGQAVSLSDRIASMITMYHRVERCRQWRCTMRVEDMLGGIPFLMGASWPSRTCLADFANKKNKGMLRLTWDDLRFTKNAAELKLIAHSLGYR